MSDFVEYSRGLLEASKGLRSQALSLPDGEAKQTFMRAAILHACSFLEAHLNYMADHFAGGEMFTLHEQGLLLEREVAFDSGKFTMKTNLKMSRMQDRIDLLLTKCASDPKAAKKPWNSGLTETLRTRNSLVHPKEVRQLKDEDVVVAITAVLTAADTLYQAVFRKGLPYAKKGIEGGLDLSPTL